MNYHNKKFKVLRSSENGEVDETLIFHYQQSGNILTCTYAGGNIISGHLIGLVDDLGHINMRYHQVTTAGELQTGICHSTPEQLPTGKIQLNEKWQWTSGDQSAGESVLIEVD